jgi:CheY-like chemotaxis protein
MPEMDGFEFFFELRKNEAWQSIPVVVVTSKDLTPEERQQLTGNVERILQKGGYSRDTLLLGSPTPAIVPMSRLSLQRKDFLVLGRVMPRAEGCVVKYFPKSYTFLIS